ncbi:WD repeat-containing protein 74-like isoform X2 [Tubulanus polymorphus]|uniref:WD repeat-containing protein 74-like isoform X2 n=1 Tax=Tubulanus polymorphus TaxID=672921 RepID=UPI003DA683AD
MAAPMNLIVGSEIGLLKGINAQKKTFQNLNDIKHVDRNHEICVMCWADSEQDEVNIGLKNHTVKTYSCESGVLNNQFKLVNVEGRLRGLARIESDFVTCTENGPLQLQNNTGDKKLEITVGENIWCMQQNSSTPNHIATGGKENDLKIWDLEKPEQPIFRAKNVRDDWLCLRVPIWVMGAQFIPDSEKIVTSTGHHQVRVYDPSTPRRRPVIDMQYDEYPLTAMSLTSNSNQIVVGNTQGSMALLDIRQGKMVHKFKGFAGGIRCIKCHPTLPYIASCGLDRFLRIHEMNSKKLIRKIYLKSRLNSMVMKSDNWDEKEDETSKSTDDDEEAEDDIDDEKLWDNMEVVTETNRKRKSNLEAKSENRTKSLRKRKTAS